MPHHVVTKGVSRPFCVNSLK